MNVAGAARSAGQFVRALSLEQWIVLASVTAVTGLAWLYLVAMAADMSDMADMVGMPDMERMAGMALVTPYAAWGAADILAAGTMWVVMMAGMMLPSALPILLMQASVARGRGEPPLLATGPFLAGYLVVWTAFSLAAVAAHWLLLRAGLLAPDMYLASGVVGGILFIAAGLYEWSPLKERCLAICHSPLGFILGHWSPGAFGALRMGILHGLYCVGCCWVLMLLLFAVGVMNLVWVAALAAAVLLQKLVPRTRIVARLSGVALVLGGVALIAGAA